MPPPVEPVQVLALLTRVRAARVEAGELVPERLYDVRAFKCCYAELGYLRRLAAAGRAGGTVVTSMRQLIAGLAALHPAWEITGEGFEDRDRHQRAVRRRLADLQAMGLLRWRIGTDLDGEERRTELELRPAPELCVEELEAAAHKLERWQARYGAALNTGSRTGIRNAAGHGRPLSASERQRRGCQHARAVARSRALAQGHRSNSAPPSGASATPTNTTPSENASRVRNACKKTSARARNQQSRKVAIAETPKTTGTENEDAGPGQSASLSSDVAERPLEAAQDSVLDVETMLTRIREREAQRRPVLEAIAAQARARAVEVASWGLDRGWPFWRLREAWVVVRHGAIAAANSGAAGAGPLYPDDYARLRRAVARYERSHSARPHGYPSTGLGALLYLGALAGAGELPGGPRTLRYAVAALDQLSRRMRALATADSTSRQHTNLRRARRRLEQPPPRTLQLSFRTSQWPTWVRTDAHGEPIFDQGMLQLDPDARCGVPAADSDAYRMTIRDAYLLAGRKLPVDVDGRKQMALRHQRQLDPAQRRPRPQPEQLELAELAHLTGEPTSLLRRLSASYRQQWLADQRQQDAARARAEILELRQRIADTVKPPPVQ